MKFLLFTSLFASLSYSTVAQTQISKLFDKKDRDGKVTVFAENHGFVPVTYNFNAELAGMNSSISLPARIIVFPRKQPQPIAIFSPEGTWPHTFHYTFSGQLGIYNGQMPDTTYAYDLPFKNEIQTTRIVFNPKTDEIPRGSYPYFFKLPDTTPICASREGIVADFRQESKSNYGKDANFIVIFHDDGTYAWYQNFKCNSVAVALGQWVKKGEIIAYSSAEKKPTPL